MNPSRWTKPFHLLLGGVVVMFALTSCTQQSPDASDSPNTPVEKPAEQVPPPTSTPDDDVPREDLVQERVIPWEDTNVVSDTSVRVSFWAGTERCYGVRYVVEETPTQISIAVIEGQLPDAPQACTMEARYATVLVETAEPVGDRQIVPLEDPALQE